MRTNAERLAASLQGKTRRVQPLRVGARRCCRPSYTIGRCESTTRTVAFHHSVARCLWLLPLCDQQSGLARLGCGRCNLRGVRCHAVQCRAVRRSARPKRVVDAWVIMLAGFEFHQPEQSRRTVLHLPLRSH